MKYFQRVFALLLIIFAALLIATPAYADIAPPRPPYASNIYPNGASTEVRMVAETVDIVLIAEASEEYPDGYAHVHAIFQMVNTGSQPETMDVYFPMNLTNCDQAVDAMNLHDFQKYPPIRDFHAIVQGIEKPVHTIYVRVPGMLSTDPRETDIACWVSFPTTFPPGKQVTIEVNYLAPPFNAFGEADPYIGYSYILHTGAGWSDTIGIADIAIHMPYPVSPENVHSFFPGQGEYQGNTITWHFENFEPEQWGDESHNLYVEILKPVIWKAIQIETQNTQADPRDGEAWGRLGKAYKQAVILHKGLRRDEAGREMYRKSVDAYQRAIALKPNDADWHAGYAELLCKDAMWILDQPQRDVFFPCVEELKKALDLNPQQEKAWSLLQEISFFSSVPGAIVDLSGSEPDYRILTPPPPTKTPRPTATKQPTAMIHASPTSIDPTPTQKRTQAAVAVVPPTSMPESQPLPETQAPGICGFGLIPVLVTTFHVWYRRHGNQ